MEESLLKRKGQQGPGLFVHFFGRKKFSGSLIWHLENLCNTDKQVVFNEGHQRSKFLRSWTAIRTERPQQPWPPQSAPIHCQSGLSAYSGTLKCDSYSNCTDYQDIFIFLQQQQNKLLGIKPSRNVGFFKFDLPFLSFQWECKTDMDNIYRFGLIEVSCEGYDHPSDVYILKGSCGLEYNLELTDEGRRRQPAGSHSGFSAFGGSRASDLTTSLISTPVSNMCNFYVGQALVALPPVFSVVPLETAANTAPTAQTHQIWALATCWLLLVSCSWLIASTQTSWRLMVTMETRTTTPLQHHHPLDLNLNSQVFNI